MNAYKLWIRLPSTLIRDSLIASSPHTLDDLSEFSLVRHNESPNMRHPIIERDAWVMLLAFPLDYQTQHYVIKAVSTFGHLLAWHRPGVNKSRVLVRVLIKEVAKVPFTIVLERFTGIGGLGQSWSIPVYILNVYNPIPGLQSNEDPLPPMGVTPHPEQNPFLNAMQQAQHDA